MIGRFDSRGLDLGEFEKALDRVVYDNIFEHEMPKILYYYTTWRGAKGILESRQFWFTAHDCTNDPAELTTADDAIVEIAQDIRRFVDVASQEMLGNLLADYPRLKISNRTRSFITCFSTLRDSKSQWKRYGNNGHGLCLGIKVLAEPPPDNTALRHFAARVQYDESSWRKRVIAGFQGICAEVSKAAARNGGLAREAKIIGLRAFYQIAGFAALTAKQSAWSSEEEWRLVALVKPHYKLTPLIRKNELGRKVEYVPLFVRQPNRPLAIEEIVIGPNQNLDCARQQLENILTRAGYPNQFAETPRVVASQVHK